MKKNKSLAAPAASFELTLDQHLKESTQAEIVAYLNACLGEKEDEEMEAFFSGLEDVARARGIAALAQGVGVARDTFYKAFASRNPTIATFKKMLNSLGMDLAIVARDKF